MEIKMEIKRQGQREGTVGWLLKGLENGTIKITEGKIRGGGEHGLFVEMPRNTINIAYFGATFQQEYAVNEEGLFSAYLKLTPACTTTLRNIAKKWCQEANKELHNEAALDVKIIRVDIENK